MYTVYVPLYHNTKHTRHWQSSTTIIHMCRQSMPKDSKQYKNQYSHVNQLTSMITSLFTTSQHTSNKSSAVAEMGDRFATIDMGWKVGRLLCPFLLGELGSNLTQCCLDWGLPPYQVGIASWSIQPFGHNILTLQTHRQDRQQSHSIGQTVLQMVAQKCCMIIISNYTMRLIKRKLMHSWLIHVAVFFQMLCLSSNICVKMTK